MSKSNDLWMDEYEAARDDFIKDQDKDRLTKRMRALGFDEIEIEEYIGAFTHD